MQTDRVRAARRYKLIGVALLLSAIAAEEACASPRGTMVGPGALMIDGMPVSCGNTPALISDQYPDFGAARPGLIILNPVRLQPLPTAARLLIYYHECAHQFVGRSELAADCWAVQQARREGLLSRAGLIQACLFIKDLPGNAHHPPGEMRCGHMARCYDDTYRQQVRAQQPVGDQPGASASGFSMIEETGLDAAANSVQP